MGRRVARGGTGGSEEATAPVVEDDKAVGTELLEAAAGGGGGLLFVETGLGEELVGKADELLLDGDGTHVATGHGPMVRLYLTEGEAGAGVTLADQRMTGIALGAQDVGTDDAMTDVGLGAETLDAGSVGTEDAKVVKHGGLGHKRGVNTQLGMAGGKGKGLVGHTAAVDQKDVSQGIVSRIIFVNDLQRIHFFAVILRKITIKMDIEQILDYKILGIRAGDPLIFALKVFLIVILARIVLTIISKVFRKAERNPRSVMDMTTRKYFERIVKFIIYIIAITSILYLIPGMEKVGSSILTSAGIMAAAIGLAAQDALSNFIGGLFIVISKPFRVGDYIALNTGVAGTVTEITLRHTVIVNTENRTILVPNSAINSSTITNSTVLDSRTCAFVEIGVSYNENLDHAIEVMRDEVMRHPMLIDPRTEADVEAGVPQVKIKVISLNDSSITLRAWAWAATSANAFNMKCDLLKSVKERFDREGIEIPYPYFNQVLVK